MYRKVAKIIHRVPIPPPLRNAHSLLLCLFTRSSGPWRGLAGQSSPGLTDNLLKGEAETSQHLYTSEPSVQGKPHVSEGIQEGDLPQALGTWIILQKKMSTKTWSWPRGRGVKRWLRRDGKKCWVLHLSPAWEPLSESHSNDITQTSLL